MLWKLFIESLISYEPLRDGFQLLFDFIRESVVGFLNISNVFDVPFDYSIVVIS